MKHLSRGSRRVALLTAAALAVVPALLVGSAATAATNGNWWYSAYHVADATAAGWTGKGVKVAVIDNQINTSLPTLKGAKLSVYPTPLCSNAGASVTTTDPNSYHGSDVTSLLIGNGAGVGSTKGIAPGAAVAFYAWGINDTTTCSHAQDPYGQALKAAVNGGAKIVTTSIGDGLDQTTAQDVAWALSKGVVLVAATPNTSPNSSSQFPGAYNGVIAVNAMNPNGTLQGQNGAAGTAPDVQPDTTVVAAGVDIADAVDANTVDSGSSYAAPLVAGMLADVWQKYPKATASQLIQSLIHNTTRAAGSDGYGYGAASLTKMLAADPTTYPNTNPLMNKASGVPTAQQVAAAGGASKATGGSSPAAQASASGSDSSQDVLVGAVIVGVVVLLVLAGIVLLIVFLVRRSRRSQVSRG